MASSKLSALTALTSVGNDDLVYVADTADGGSSYSSKKVTKANLFSGYATETYVSTQISNLIDGAPDALNTLNEIAAAINDDDSIASSLTTLINANETHVDNMATLTGVAKDSTSLGTFTGATIADNQTVKAALQSLETAVEAAGSATSLNAVIADASDLQTLTGIADGNSNLGTFSGSTISNSTDIKTALQELETAVEGNVGGSTTVEVVNSATNANHYLTFVDSANTSGTQESVFTDAGVYYNPFLNQFTANGVNTGVLSLSGVDVTATAAELNKLDGVTATTAELNILDGVTATATELNKLDGCVATTTHFNYLQGLSGGVQTQLDTKTADGDNVNVLVGSTSAGTVPVDGNGDENYLFLVVNKANGAIVTIDKTFIEAEG